MVKKRRISRLRVLQVCRSTKCAPANYNLFFQKVSGELFLIRQNLNICRRQQSLLNGRSSKNRHYCRSVR